MEPENNGPLDAALEEGMRDLQADSFRKTIRAARIRRRRRQVALWGMPLLFFFVLGAFQKWDPAEVHVPNRIVRHPTSVGPVMGSVPPATEKKETKLNIPTLTDDEFNELMKGYPLAIIRKNGETHYIPLN